MEKVKNVVEKILSERRFLLKEISFDYKMPSGEWIKKNWEIFDRGNGVTILLYDKARRIVILSRQFRMPAKINGLDSGFLTELPAGMIDDGELPEQAVIRETKEETGYNIEDPILIQKAYSSPGAMTEINYLFAKEISSEMKVGNGGGLISEHEDIELLEIDFDEVKNLINKGEILDAKSLILLQHALIHHWLD